LQNDHLDSPFFYKRSLNFLVFDFTQFVTLSEITIFNWGHIKKVC